MSSYSGMLNGWIIYRMSVRSVPSNNGKFILSVSAITSIMSRSRSATRSRSPVKRKTSADAEEGVSIFSRLFYASSV